MNYACTSSEERAKGQCYAETAGARSCWRTSTEACLAQPLEAAEPKGRAVIRPAERGWTLG